MRKIHFKQSFIDKKSLESRPEEDFGFNYDTYDDFTTYDNRYYTEAGIVSIDRLIDILQDFKSKGANYVACDWHCDHQELDLYGFEFRKATEEEIAEKELEFAKREANRKADEIRQLEAKLEKLKTLKLKLKSTQNDTNR